MQATRSIQVLDDATIGQIAAGEVIERPVSVVKELVENSLDAGAKTITVELGGGGCDSIAVLDDGSGIAVDELVLAVTRHATSKLQRRDDLFAISTLGFRGEGLASIAAAGRLEITSRRADADVGARVVADATTISDPTAASASPGTKVVVHDLFALVPARREFLKSARAEFARVSAFLSQLSLGWPEVTFVLRSEGREIWVLPATAHAVDRLENVFGRESRGALAALDEDAGVAREKVSGFISTPGHDRPTRNQQVFFVNGRLVRSSALGSAWQAGAGTFGMGGRYPYGVVRIDVPAEDVDVNVHPTKSEVRFRFGKAVFDAVRRAVARTMRRSTPERAAPMPVLSALGIEEDAFTRESVDASAAALDAFAADVAPHAALPFVGHGTMRVFGQIDNTYIAASDGASLILIDQHAAHERIAYEALVAGSGAPDASAPMLFPTVVELTPDRAAAMHEHQDELTAAGVVIESFGENAFRISALPAGFGNRRFDLAGVIDDLADDAGGRDSSDRRLKLFASIACHSVVRAHEPLALQEQVVLWERLRACREPHTCPHGRPTTMRLDVATLAKAFKRS
jgi:DNA mismatch repair protein MutL